MIRPFLAILIVGPILGNTALASQQILIPGTTELFIQLNKGVSSKTSKPGDRFVGTIQVPVTTQDRIVIPVGTFITGRVEQVKRAGHLKGRARLQVVFEELIFPDGKRRKLAAVVQSSGTYRTDHESETAALVATGSQGDEVLDPALNKLEDADATPEEENPRITGVFNGNVLRMGVASISQAAGESVLGLLDRGQPVDLSEGSWLTLQLSEDLQLEPIEP